MREISFRGKRRDNGEWSYGSLQCFKGYSIFDNIWKNFISVDSKTIGQYTGKKDKNGMKIYEGDIVQALMDYGPGGFLNSRVMIGWDEDCGWQWNYFDMSTIEVIGNIHDNPNLLRESIYVPR